tara:strand:+ start:2259 stop:2564 length:306 start_codon:yes stop_codon:yes gene_type:complete
MAIDIYDEPKQKIFSAYDTSFVSGDSPVTLDVGGILLRNGIDGYIDNYGTGDLYYQISFDGTNYGSAIYLPTTDTDSLRGLSIAKLKITHVADTKYRVRIV